ncbi:hypothetical protein GC105_13255 [Alkalibaculum sp. M08DMB]|uniref:DUF2680 domain-containing protein n=1 Tax=Alkalibaculum sporogenes TaxID=2655001 RepID=A0A6A7KCL7_9FIRM|nr:hypothetical protein [Alkalibaculum sporogenes]MPW26753.1 hypothetical protein [Alkalibaculum sporogenes]
MKFKKISGFLATLMLLSTFGTATLASTTIATNNEIKNDPPSQSEEQKTDMKIKHSEMKEKWSTLSDEQKEEIYKLMDKEIDIRIESINYYLSLGIIDEETATKMKEKLTENKIQIRERDQFPIFSKKHRER